VLVAVAAAVMLAESGTVLSRAPLMPAAASSAPVYRWLASTPADTVVLELPQSTKDDVEYMLQSLFHRRRLANGYTTIVPGFFPVTASFPDETDVAALQDAGVDFVILHADRLRATGRAPLLDAARAASALHPRNVGDDVVLTVPPDARDPSSAAAGVELPRHAWRLTATDDDPALAADGRLDTHWTPRAQTGSTLRLDLGAARRLEGIAVHLGRHVLEYPRAYTVWASTDAEHWAEVGGEVHTLPPLASYRRDHHAVVVPLRFRPTLARWFEVRVPATPKPPHLATDDPPPLWGVHELVVRVADGS
jgi:hypothetical protein